MTTIEYFFLTGFVVAGLYTTYRLFLGWLRTPSEPLALGEAETADGASIASPPTVRPTVASSRPVP